MSIDQFVEWVGSLPFYKGWNFNFNYARANDGSSSYTFMATLGDKCHRYTRNNLQSLQQGVQTNLDHIKEQEDASQVS